jgi:zinc-ribbon domain
VDQITGVTPPAAPTQAQDESQPPADLATVEPSGFGARGRARRRARFLRKARELAYRDLGGLVFNLHRFGQRNDALVLAKLTTLSQIDGELRTLEAALSEREAVTVLREAGVTACPRCAAIHSSEDRFCPNCGLPMSRQADLPIAAPAAPATPVSAQTTPGVPAAQPAPVGGATSEPDATPPAPTPTPPPAVSTPAAPSNATPPTSSQAPAAAPGRSPTPPQVSEASTATSPTAPGSPAGTEATEILRPRPPGS